MKRIRQFLSCFAVAFGAFFTTLALTQPGPSPQVTVVGPVTPGHCTQFASPGGPTQLQDAGGTCAATAPVQSVSNSDGTLTISPTTGVILASIALAHRSNGT